MRSKEEIFKQMREEMPWQVIGETQLKPYILEAMQIYADEYHNARNQANGDEARTETALPIQNVSIAKRKLPVAAVIRRNAKLMDAEHFDVWYNEVIGNKNT